MMNDFKVGDIVEYTNPAGLKFGPYKVLGFRDNNEQG